MWVNMNIKGTLKRLEDHGFQAIDAQIAYQHFLILLLISLVKCTSDVLLSSVGTV